MKQLNLNAEQLFSNLGRMPAFEREKFFLLLGKKASQAFDAESQSHDQVFGHLKGAEFTAVEAADYLEISMATFRRYVRAGKVKAVREVGSSHLYPLEGLRDLKQAMKLAKT